METLFMFGGLGFLLLVIALVRSFNTNDYIRELHARREFGIPMTREKTKKNPLKK